MIAGARDLVSSAPGDKITRQVDQYSEEMADVITVIHSDLKQLRRRVESNVPNHAYGKLALVLCSGALVVSIVRLAVALLFQSCVWALLRRHNEPLWGSGFSKTASCTHAHHGGGLSSSKGKNGF